MAPLQCRTALGGTRATVQPAPIQRRVQHDGTEAHFDGNFDIETLREFVRIEREPYLQEYGPSYNDYRLAHSPRPVAQGPKPVALGLQPTAHSLLSNDQ